MCENVILLPSKDGQDFATVAGVPLGMSPEDAKDRAEYAVVEFNEADRLWCDAEDSGETEGMVQPSFSDFLTRNGLLVFKNILTGPQWD